jgi:MFS family permease
MGISWLLGFGVLVGTGIAFGYSPSTPAAIKWFPPHKVGRITGVVVAGFGLASVYIAPLTTWLLGVGQLQSTMLMFVAISITCYAANTATNAFLLVFLTTLIGFNYGANLTVFPSFTKDMWGIKNFGMNYGLLFTAWGVGGLVMSRVSQYLVVRSGSFRISLMCAGILLLAGACLIMMVKDEKDQLRRVLVGTKSKKSLAANAAVS